MPLPPALAARLAKRGIIPKEDRRGEEEEVFAENYDRDEDDDGARGNARRRGTAGADHDKTRFMVTHFIWRYSLFAILLLLL